jgi:hypothetical protein
MEKVQFIGCEEDGTDQIVSFAITHGEIGVKSLILLRTPKYESMLGEMERGVSVSLEHQTDDDFEALVVVRLGSNRLTIETEVSKYHLDVSRVDPAELSEMRALIERMNFDERFTIEDA